MQKRPLQLCLPTASLDKTSNSRFSRASAVLILMRASAISLIRPRPIHGDFDSTISRATIIFFRIACHTFSPESVADFYTTSPYPTILDYPEIFYMRRFSHSINKLLLIRQQQWPLVLLCSFSPTPKDKCVPKDFHNTTSYSSISDLDSKSFNSPKRNLQKTCWILSLTAALCRLLN